MERMRIKIGGMHCKNCVTLLSDEFGKISGVHHVEISLTKAVGDIYYESEAPSMEALVAVAEKHGYTVRADDRPLSEAEKAAGRKHELRQWLLGFFGAGLVIAIFLLLQSSGIVDAINPGDKLSHAGLAVVIGLVASVSSCFAVVGSLVLAFSELYRGGERESAGGGAIRANALFHAGRLAAFFLLGGALGLVGGSLSVSGRTLSIFTIVYAVVMLFMGLSILSGGKISIGIKLPVPAFARDWFARLKASRHPATPLLLGAITFFLPCGFTQSMQVLALGSGGFMQGGLVMFLFALGTLPVLFLTGLSASWTHRRGFTFLTKSAGILIIVFALFTFFSGTALFDFQGNVFADAASQTSAVATVASNSDPGRESSDQAPDQQGLNNPRPRRSQPRKAQTYRPRPRKARLRSRRQRNQWLPNASKCTLPRADFPRRCSGLRPVFRSSG
jgi:sulfite exporter TauE/SafE/copper chaperone CopZ